MPGMLKTKETLIDDDGIPPALTPEDGRRMFNRAARRNLKMSGDEFLRKWDVGEFAAVFEDPKYHSKLVRLWMMLPLAREVPARARHNAS